MSDGKDRGFKVVDRRRFNSDGDERDDAPEEIEAPPPVAAQAPAPQPEAQPEQQPEPEPEPQPEPVHAEEEEAGEGELTFAIFVQSLAQQAMMQLGLVPWPHTGQRGIQLEQARDTIDVLTLLEAKTKGNLTQSEAQMLQTVLYELRLTYVEINQQLAAAAKAPPAT